MNIYLHIEVSSRELDSNLLLAVLAAVKGHQVIISSLPEIVIGLKKRVLAPGIFHTKSLTPSRSKIQRHQEIINNKSLITCIDEESGLSLNDYEQFAKSRYSELSIKQSSAIFGWGSEDTDFLKKTYPQDVDKIHKTGSPRADLWKPFLLNYWVDPKGLPNKPFLLISSNMICNWNKKLSEVIKFYKTAGYFERNTNLLKNFIHANSEDFKKLYAFIDAIKYLANKIEYDIVLRPHPAEDPETWKTLFEDVPNVHIIRNDSITAWVKKAFALLHNGCTTALEGTISGKPVLTYSPFKMEYDNKLFNLLGYTVKSKEELLIKANEFFYLDKNKSKEKLKSETPKLIFDKLYIDKNELAAEKILKVWEKLNDKHKGLSESNNWLLFFYFLKIVNIRKITKNILAKIFPNKFEPKKQNLKFASLDEKDIQARINRLRSILNTKNKIKCKLLSSRTILIKSY
jgi:surface carbohydrate biosynthesis protein